MTTFHDALHTLIQTGPGGNCEDCSHFSYQHIDRRCDFPGSCACRGMKWKGQRIRIGPTGPMDEPSFTCPQCDMTSYNPNDIEWGFCGNCHGYTGVVDPMMKARRMIEERQ